MLIEGREYGVVIATDAGRDAMQWEFYHVDGADEKLVFEIVRFDGRKEWSFIQHVEAVPLAVVEYAVQHARTQLGPFFND
jgi:hypothetical protein